MQKPYVKHTIFSTFECPALEVMKINEILENPWRSESGIWTVVIFQFLLRFHFIFNFLFKNIFKNGQNSRQAGI